MKRISHFFKKYFIPHELNDHQPHIFRGEAICALFIIIIAVELGFLVNVFVIFDRTNFLASVLPGAIATLTNEERAANGAAPLTENALLDRAAQLKAEDMAQNGYFAHTSPEGKTPWYWFAQVGYRYVYAGENLAVNFFESEEVANAWMNSPTHRANIVKKDYTEIGIGVATGTYQGRATVFVAQLFGAPVPVPAQPAAKPVTPAGDIPTPKSLPTTPPAAAPAKTAPAQFSAEPVASSPAPESTTVLGEETITNQQAITETSRELSALKAFTQRLLTSPRQYVNFIYGGVAALIFIALMLLLFVRSEVHHPHIVARGAGLMAVIIFLLFLNLTLVASPTQVPADTVEASVVAY